jgi:hypothetical protein
VSIDPARSLNVFLRHVLARRHHVGRRQLPFDLRPLVGGHVVGEIDRHLRRAAPFRREALQIGRDDQKAAEHEQRERDGADREEARLAPAPEARRGFGRGVAQRPHHATSTTRP